MSMYSTQVTLIENFSGLYYFKYKNQLVLHYVLEKKKKNRFAQELNFRKNICSYWKLMT